MTNKSQGERERERERESVKSERIRRRRLRRLYKRLRPLLWPFTLHANYTGCSLDVYCGDIPYATIQLRFNYVDRHDHYLLVYYRRDRVKKPRSSYTKTGNTNGESRRCEHCFPALGDLGLPDVGALYHIIRAELKSDKTQVIVPCENIPLLRDRSLPEYPAILRSYDYRNGRWEPRDPTHNNVRHVEDAQELLVAKFSFTPAEAEECRRLVYDDLDYSQLRTKFFYSGGGRLLWYQLCRIFRLNKSRVPTSSI